MSVQVKDKLVTVEELKVVRDNSVTGVKGNADNSYSQGNVNLAPANIGAVSKSGDTMTGNLSVFRDGSAIIEVKDTSMEHSIQLGSWHDGSQGLWSLGYINGNNVYVNDPAWMIRRGTTGDVIINGTASGNVVKTGDIMSGNLVLERSADSEITLKSKPGSSYPNYATLQLGNWSYEGSTKNQGLYSTGYYDSNNNYHGESSDRIWLIHRSSTDGKVHVTNHYDESAIDSKFANYYDKSDVDNKFTDRLSNFKFITVQQTVTIAAGSSGNPTQTTITINNIPSGKNIFEAMSMWLGGYRIPYITNNGAVQTWISGISGSTITFSNYTSAWSNYSMSAVLLIY